MYLHHPIIFPNQVLPIFNNPIDPHFDPITQSIDICLSVDKYFLPEYSLQFTIGKVLKIYDRTSRQHRKQVPNLGLEKRMVTAIHFRETLFQYHKPYRGIVRYRRIHRFKLLPPSLDNRTSLSIHP